MCTDIIQTDFRHIIKHKQIVLQKVVSLDQNFVMLTVVVLLEAEKLQHDWGMDR